MCRELRWDSRVFSTCAESHPPELSLHFMLVQDARGDPKSPHHHFRYLQWREKWIQYRRVLVSVVFLWLCTACGEHLEKPIACISALQGSVGLHGLTLGSGSHLRRGLGLPWARPSPPISSQHAAVGCTLHWFYGAELL